mgnify:CR=1 FL=1
MKIDKGEGLKKGGKAGKDRIKELQRELKAAGYWDDDINGEFSEELEKAVKRFQKDRHLEPEDGEAGKETGIALNAYVEGLQAGDKSAKAPEGGKGNEPPKDDPTVQAADLEKANIEMKKDIIKRLEDEYKKSPSDSRLKIQIGAYEAESADIHSARP